MKRRLLTIIGMSLLFLYSGLAQNVPNGGFESWEMRSLYEQPEEWNTGNQEAFMFGGTQTALKVEDAYSGNYALRLESAMSGEDLFFGYAFSNGMITGGGLEDTLRFMGGFPVAASPDSLFGYFKYEPAAEDTAFVLVSFKKDGNYIGQNVFFLTGSQTSYLKHGFELQTMAETPDTAMIAFACTDPGKAVMGGFLQVDSIWFGNLPDVIPNADFENWQEQSYQDPEHWVTTNFFALLFDGPISATPSADAHSGSLALRLEAVNGPVPAEGGLTDMVTGFAMAFGDVLSFGEAMPSFPVDFNPSELTGYYKYTPAIDDSAMIYVVLYDAEGPVYSNATLCLAAEDYTMFNIALDYPTETIITEVTILVSTSIHFMDDDPDGAEEGSVLLLDDLHLVDPCEALAPYEIDNVIQGTCDDLTAVIDAGDGWDEYIWSNDSTGQVIEVEVTEDMTISVTVVDSETGCEFSDEVELIAPTGCEDAIEDNVQEPAMLEIYPNPGQGVFSLQFHNLEPGDYYLEILSITGKKLIGKTLACSRRDNVFTFDISSLAHGMYLLKVSGDRFNLCERIIIQ